MSDVVDLSIPVDADLVVLARLAATTVASRAGFDVEEIEDLRLAVDELCLSVIEGATDGRLDLHLVLDGDTIEVACTLVDATGVDGSAPRPPTSELSLRILEALVDGHGHESKDGRRRAWLSKRATTQQGSG